jgi:hypothetical protein
MPIYQTSSCRTEVVISVGVGAGVSVGVAFRVEGHGAGDMEW